MGTGRHVLDHGNPEGIVCQTAIEFIARLSVNYRNLGLSHFRMCSCVNCRLVSVGKRTKRARVWKSVSLEEC